MSVCNTATGESLFKGIDNELRSHTILWGNIVKLCTGSACGMVCKRYSVLSQEKEIAPDIFSLGCVCHLANLCAAAALKTLPISMDSLIVDTFYYFRHSTKRCEHFHNTQREFGELQPVHILKQSTSRWLSVRQCLQRLLKQWEPLHAYFDRQQDIECGNDCVQKVTKPVDSPFTCLICQFVLLPWIH